MTTNDRSQRLWVFSFDGALTAPGADRTKARLHRLTRQLLEELAGTPGELVAVLSSRSLEDLVSRVPIPGVFLGGGCGTEWHIPGGESMTLSGRPKELLMEKRDELLPTLRELADLPGVTFDDRRWSAAIHTAGTVPKVKRTLDDRLQQVCRERGVALYRCPDMVEVQFLPEITMEFGVRALCRFLKHKGAMVCAGSDANDATALRWVVRQGGTALSIGRRPLVPGASAVVDLRSLVRQTRDLVSMRDPLPTRRPEHRYSKAA
ncbi:trehalose-phosphatase [Geobacter sp.]|uniref:trehalose-phosphatase n=1 Tax=Geobacter sp. TaxID=46610 RepID=UPI0027BA17EE|nr:trehalose-phosphatase [Geobacter sp.]